jgi:hypothetical protein
MYAAWAGKSGGEGRRQTRIDDQQAHPALEESNPRTEVLQQVHVDSAIAGNREASSPKVKAPLIVSAPTAIQTSNNQKDEPSDLATPAGRYTFAGDGHSGRS